MTIPKAAHRGAGCSRSSFTVLPGSLAGTASVRPRRRKAVRLTRNRPRSLTAPPGIPSHISRPDRGGRVDIPPGTRVLGAGADRPRRGRSVDDVSRLRYADVVGESHAPYAWCGPDVPLDLGDAGEHVLCTRATDETVTHSRSSPRRTSRATRRTKSSSASVFTSHQRDRAAIRPAPLFTGARILQGFGAYSPSCTVRRARHRACSAPGANQGVAHASAPSDARSCPARHPRFIASLLATRALANPGPGHPSAPCRRAPRPDRTPFVQCRRSASRVCSSQRAVCVHSGWPGRHQGGDGL